MWRARGGAGGGGRSDGGTRGASDLRKADAAKFLRGPLNRVFAHQGKKPAQALIALRVGGARCTMLAAWM